MSFDAIKVDAIDSMTADGKAIRSDKRQPLLFIGGSGGGNYSKCDAMNAMRRWFQFIRSGGEYRGIDAGKFDSIVASWWLLVS